MKISIKNEPESIILHAQEGFNVIIGDDDCVTTQGEASRGEIALLMFSQFDRYFKGKKPTRDGFISLKLPSGNEITVTRLGAHTDSVNEKLRSIVRYLDKLMTNKYGQIMRNR